MTKSVRANGNPRTRLEKLIEFHKNKCPEKSGHLFLIAADRVFTQPDCWRFFVHADFPM
ncbi:hypothetical protein EMIT0P253_50255 [Pseudomonas sp. IT-P253]